MGKIREYKEALRINKLKKNWEETMDFSRKVFGDDKKYTHFLNDTLMDAVIEESGIYEEHLNNLAAGFVL